jgi:hypothetical protein
VLVLFYDFFLFCFMLKHCLVSVIRLPKFTPVKCAVELKAESDQSSHRHFRTNELIVVS